MRLVSSGSHIKENTYGEQQALQAQLREIKETLAMAIERSRE